MAGNAAADRVEGTRTVQSLCDVALQSARRVGGDGPGAVMPRPDTGGYMDNPGRDCHAFLAAALPRGSGTGATRGAQRRRPSRPISVS